MKNITIISATTARNRWFELINWINAEKREVWIKRRNKIVLKIYPGYTPSFEDQEVIIKKTRGMLRKKANLFPYQENKRVIRQEKDYLRRVKEWPTK